jgi:uncharacterized protein (DUF488 family)
VAHPFFTIGHSTRTIEEYLSLLRSSGVTQVVDVRTVPRSRTNPQYNREAVSDTLAASRIGYEHIASLGGLRGRQLPKEDSPNTFWDNQSFRNYADYALSAEFREGLARLRHLGSVRRTAIMCAEAVWWRCHRRIIADYLLAAGEEVFHILDRDHVDTARMTPAARPDGEEGLIYPAGAAGQDGR